MFLGIPSLLYDKDVRRRSLYGKAGCFRLCPYGFEYRVLSSAMMKDVKSLQFVWNQIIRAIKAYNRQERLISPEQVVPTINNSDVKSALRLIKNYDLCVD